MLEEGAWKIADLSRSHVNRAVSQRLAKLAVHALNSSLTAASLAIVK